MRISSSRRLVLVLALLAMACIGSVRPGFASGPHWVAGVNYFQSTAKGKPVVWAGGQVSYYLDQGALSSSVSNSAAGYAVAQAAAVWSSVPTAAVAITQGGSLSEDVNGSNVTANVPAGSGATLPTDAQPSATSKPLGIVFDADGSVINDIYGIDASDPNDCTHNGVFSTVDNFSSTGTIAHALIIVNGLCATSTALDGLLQYELVRAFGRVLGLDWSQVNEAMWQTGYPTSEGLAGWPVMHPYERLCTGSQTNCMPNQTTLRLDDIAGLNQLYPVTEANAGSWSGKTLTASSTITVQGTISFRNGQGMQGVNVVLTPLDASGNPNLSYTVTAISGAYFRTNSGNAVTGPADAQGNLYGRFGTDDATKEGYFSLTGVPLPPGQTSNAYQLSIEPINPLYSGNTGLGPYAMNQVAPSGAMQKIALGILSAGATVTQNFTMSDSADGTATDDGAEAQPNPSAGNGVWVSKLVGYGHTGWFQFHARANRSFTVEAAAVDERGLGTEGKSAALIGLWNGTDPMGSLPDMETTQPFNGAAVGLTTLSALTQADGEIRFAYADQRGDGRPDFTYRARVLYADSVFPARLTLNGGPISIQGQGFRPGMAVLINGVSAAVTSVTPTEITAVAPAVSAATGTVVLQVRDPQTYGFTEILDGLSYDAQGTDGVRIVSAPTGTVSEGVPVPMTVQVVAGDGVTPAANVSVSFAVNAGAAGLSCGSSPCTAMTNGSGFATVMVMPESTQATQVSATLTTGASVMAEFDAGTPPQIAAVNTLYVAGGGAAVTWTPQAIVLSGGAPVQGTGVLWTAGSTAVQVSSLSGISSTTNAAGLASTTVTVASMPAGSSATLYACEAPATPCTTFTVNAVHMQDAGLLPASGVGQSLSATGIPMPVTLEVIDGAGQPTAGATVNFYQGMDAWAPPCPAQGRCPVPQELGSLSSTATSDQNGLVSLTPMSNNGQPAVLHILATTGQQGSLSFTITEHP